MIRDYLYPLKEFLNFNHGYSENFKGEDTLYMDINYDGNVSAYTLYFKWVCGNRKRGKSLYLVS